MDDSFDNIAVVNDIEGTVDLVNSTINGTGNGTDGFDENFGSEWLGYIALCMFSMVLLVPTMGIVGLMVYEYFSEEAERKAERQKEIETAMRTHFGTLEDKKDDDRAGLIQHDDDDGFSTEEDIKEVDTVLREAETMLHKRHRIRKAQSSPDDFDEILT